jgi:hypothetical protein
VAVIRQRIPPRRDADKLLAHAVQSGIRSVT